MGGCPSREQLANLLDERLCGPEADPVGAHVQTCPQCQKTLHELSDTNLLGAGPQPTLDLQAPCEPSPEFLEKLKGNRPPLAGPEAAAQAGPDKPAAPDVRAVSVPGYEVVSELGRGGMGVVYLAWQTRLARLTALKMVLAGTHAGPEQLARFRTEAEAVARLHHPNIVQIYDVGEQDGRPYLVFEYVEGGTLARKLAGTPLPARPAAELVETLARAVHYAHERGVVHRDLTPRNVLLTAAGQPKLTDFGLAKLLAGGVGPTVTGEILGTPSYMAPEQAAGKVRQAGPPADVYALGAILYEGLTGRPPFNAETPLDTLLQVAAVEPVPPRRLQPKVPCDLETITLKCLRKEPQRRYASALELAEDLRHFLAHEPIRARPVGRAERVWRWCRRNPGVAALTSAVALLLLTVAVVSSAAFFQLKAVNKQEHASRVRAEENLQVARDVIAYFTKLSEDPRLKPRGLEQLQRDMWRQSKDFYGQLVRQQSDDPRVEAGRGLTFVRLGRVAALLGSTEEARDSQGQAQEIFQRLLREHGDLPEYADGLAQALLEQGTLYQLAGQWAEARSVLDQALPIYQRLTRDHPEEFAYQARLSLAYSLFGRFYQTIKQPEPARTYYAKALATYEPLGEGDLRDAPGPVLLARIHINLGTVSAMPGLSALPGKVSNSEQARGHYVEALRVLGQLDRQYPDVPEYQHLMAVTHHQLGVLLRGSSQYGEALEEFGKALSLVEPLARDHKDVVDYQFRLGNSLHAQGYTFLLQNRFTEARASYEKAAAVMEQLAQQHPTPDNQRELASLIYDRACLEALNATAVLQDPKLAPADRQVQNDHYCRAATEYLRKAWAAGFNNYYPDALKQIKIADLDLKALRERDDFKKLVADLEKDRRAQPPPAAP
jgi:tetratricopeptide (TPR) repeat protein